MKKLFLITVSTILALQALYTLHAATPDVGGEKSEDRAVIVDTDMGMDDARALLMITGSPGIRLAAVITTGGSASAAKAADNAIGIIESSQAGYVPVIRGITPDLSGPPPWRKYAETLGGHPFPPPRDLSQQPLAEAASGEEGIPDGIWLVLGPLSSLAALEGLVPGTLRGTEIWMPAAFEDGAARGWNIGCDTEAARTVLEEAGRVFIVDTSVDIDALRILRGVEGDTPAAKWIKATMETKNEPHAFLYDELAAAAVASPHIFRISSERYAVSGANGEAVSLEQSEEGNISIVSLEDEAALEHVLHGAWERNPDEFHGQAGHSHHHAGSADPVALMKQFHGHLGPYVVLGYRMGMIALERTGSSGHFNITAEVHSVLKPPHSCLIDGVQLGSGCTLGKRNIAIEETTGPPFAVFTTSAGMKVKISLLPHVPAMLKRSIDSKGVEATGLEVWETDADSLFEINAGY